MTKELSIELEDIYIQSLELNIIEYVSKQLQVDTQKAINIYYTSKLCQQIHQKSYDIQYLDYKYLAEDLIENEKISI